LTALGARVGKYVLNPVNRYTRPFCWVAVIARPLLFLFVLASPAAAQSNEPKRVLILLENDSSWPAYRLIVENARATIRAGSSGGIFIFDEHLDRVLFPEPHFQAQQAAWIQRKYASSKLDLVIAVGDVPTDMFPNVPLLYLGSDPLQKPPARLALSKDGANIWLELDARKTLEVARRFQPKARQIVVIGGTAPTETNLLGQIRSQIDADSDQLPIIYLTNYSFSEICQRVAALEPNTIVLFVSLGRDGAGNRFISAEAIRKIAADSRAPVYTLTDTHVGSGAVGGYVTSFAEMGKQAGETGLRMLSGEHPQNAVARNDYLFDWRQLRRWKISESSLPSGSVVLYRQPNIWDSYKYYILGAVLLSVTETLLTLGLLWQRAKWKKAQKSLVERMVFEKILSELSANFINLSEDQVGATIEKSLGRIAEFLKLNRITLFDYSHERKEWKLIISWRGEGIEAPPAVLGINQLPWWSDLLLRGDAILVSDLDSVPEQVPAERAYLRQIGAVSVAVIPLKAGGDFFGGISFVNTQRRMLWTKELVEQLKLLAEIFSNALMRQRAQDARFRHAAIVESSDDAIVSKNLDGIIMSWNAAAQRLFGFSEVEAVGKSITMLIPYELRHEEDIFLQRLNAGERVEHYETVRVAKGGRRVAVSLTISAVKDSTGRIVGHSKIARDITDRKRAEQILRESEERFCLVANTAPVLIWMSGIDKLCNFFNQGWLNFTGRSMGEELGEGWVAGVHPDDVQRCLEIYSTSFDARVDFEMEYRLRRFDGAYRWIVDYGVPRFQSDGTFCGYIGSCVDITERKSSAESLHALTARLIHAQEEERARIARELHDDFSQSLALQCIDLEQLQKKLPELEAEERARLLKMLKRTKTMSADIRSLSHELHSSKLEFVGLVPAVSGLCKEIGEQYKIEVHFTEREIPLNIPKDVALCLFRVTQEALGNVVKHSQAKKAHVEMGANANGVSLRITDEGMGFDPNVASPSDGIGLLGMTERVRLVGGRLLIKSELMQGTEILAEVPLSTSANESRVRTIAAGGTES
jgi:PAS domain S-box-containing protein